MDEPRVRGLMAGLNLGHPWNHKRVHRVYCRLKLNLPRRTKRRPPVRERQPLLVVPEINAVWALDLMHDTLYGGKVFRILNVIDEAKRGALGIDIQNECRAEMYCRNLSSERRATTITLG